MNDLFERQQSDFAMYSNFMDGWGHADHVFSSIPQHSVFRLLGALPVGNDLYEFHPHNLKESKKQWKIKFKQSKKIASKSLNKYAITSLFHWLDTGFGFMEATSLPMLVAKETIGSVIGDDDFQVQLGAVRHMVVNSDTGTVE